MASTFRRRVRAWHLILHFALGSGQDRGGPIPQELQLIDDPQKETLAKLNNFGMRIERYNAPRRTG